MRILPLLLFSAFIMIAYLGSPALAARPARVEVEEAPVFQALTPDSRVLRTLARGSRIVVSNVPTQGFYKVRTSEGEIGWVSEKALQVLERPTPEEVNEFERRRREYKSQMDARQAAAEEAEFEEGEQKKRFGQFDFTPGMDDKREKMTSRKGPRRWLVSAYYGTNQFLLGAIRSLTELDIPRNGRQFALELHYLHAKNWIPFIFRFETLGMSEYLTESSSGRVYQFEASSTPLYIGMRLDIAEESSFAVDFAAMVGMALNQNFKSTRTDTGGVTEMSSNALGAILKADFHYNFSEQWFAGIELGYRYLKSPEAGYSDESANASGNTIFKRDGALRKVPIDLSGLFASIGFSYSF